MAVRTVAGTVLLLVRFAVLAGRRLERRVPHLHDLHDEVHADLEQRRDVGLHGHDVLDADDEVVVGDADLGQVEMETEVVAALQPHVEVVVEPSASRGHWSRTIGWRQVIHSMPQVGMVQSGRPMFSAMVT